MVFHHIPYFSTPAIPWHPIAFHGIPRFPSYSMVFHCIPCYSMLFQAIPCYSIVFHIIPCYSKLFHGFHGSPLSCDSMPSLAIPCHPTLSDIVKIATVDRSLRKVLTKDLGDPLAHDFGASAAFQKDCFWDHCFEHTYHGIKK